MLLSDNFNWGFEVKFEFMIKMQSEAKNSKVFNYLEFDKSKWARLFETWLTWAIVIWASSTLKM